MVSAVYSLFRAGVLIAKFYEPIIGLEKHLFDYALPALKRTPGAKLYFGDYNDEATAAHEIARMATPRQALDAADREVAAAGEAPDGLIKDEDEPRATQEDDEENERDEQLEAAE